jgi:hypothetical protein
MRLVKKVVLLILLAALLGCAAVRNDSLKQETKLSISQKVIEGRTTKSEIQAMFNSPTFSSFDTGLEVWKYELSETNPEIDVHESSVDIHGTPIKNAPDFPSTRHIKKELIVIFDEKGIVKKYSYSTFPSF